MVEAICFSQKRGGRYRRPCVLSRSLFCVKAAFVEREKFLHHLRAICNARARRLYRETGIW